MSEVFLGLNLDCMEWLTVRRHHRLQIRSPLLCVRPGRSIWSMRTSHSAPYTTSVSNPQESWPAILRGNTMLQTCCLCRDLRPLLHAHSSAPVALYSCPGAQILPSSDRCNPPVWDSCQREQLSMWFCFASILQFIGP